MDWENAQELEGGKGVTIPNKWLFLHYYEALTVLFRVENALRALVFVVLKNARGAAWLEVNVSTDESDQTTIGALARKRVAQGQTHGYLGYQITSPMMHLTSGELVRVLVSEGFWPFFKPYFNAAKHVVTLKLEEIGIIRNSLAHFRPLTANDVEVVKQNANQVLVGVESTLASIVQLGQRVPTNCCDEWYLNLRSLGGQRSKVVFNQSADGAWIKLSVEFSAAPVRMSPAHPRNYGRYTFLTLNPVGILNRYESIRAHVTATFEKIPYLTMPEDHQPSLTKRLTFVFARPTIAEHFQRLRGDLETLLADIDQESDLITDDNLAKGELVQLVDVSANRRGNEGNGPWQFNLTRAAFPVTGRDPAEYWGDIDAVFGDFVSDVERFPWMPVDISRVSYPF